MKTLLALFSASLLTLSGAALAGGDETKRGMQTSATFESLDKNSDEQLSRAEASESEELANNFASLDANNDGYISQNEYDSHKERT